MRSHERKLASALVLGLLVGLAGTSARAQRPDLPPYHKEPCRLDTGKHTNLKAEATMPFDDIVVAPGAAWMQLRISECNLGAKSYITISSTLDGGTQRLDAKSLKDWHNNTAFFNGDSVVVKLHVAPGEKGIFVAFDQMMVGEWVSGVPEDDGPLESICGADDRVASTDARVGRLMVGGCTAWLASNGTVLTAGHCSSPFYL